MAKEYYVTTCTNYNGHRNVLFMMEAADVEWRNEIANKGGQKDLFPDDDKRQYILGERVLTVSRNKSTVGAPHPHHIIKTKTKQYRLFADHSLKEII